MLWGYRCSDCRKTFASAASMYHSTQCVVCRHIEDNRQVMFQGATMNIYEEQGPTDWFEDLDRDASWTLTQVFSGIALGILAAGVIVAGLYRLASWVMAPFSL